MTHALIEHITTTLNNVEMNGESYRLASKLPPKRPLKTLSNYPLRTRPPSNYGPPHGSLMRT